MPIKIKTNSFSKYEEALRHQLPEYSKPEIIIANFDQLLDNLQANGFISIIAEIWTSSKITLQNLVSESFHVACVTYPEDHVEIADEICVILENLPRARGIAYHEIKAASMHLHYHLRIYDHQYQQGKIKPATISA